MTEKKKKQLDWLHSLPRNKEWREKLRMVHLGKKHKPMSEEGKANISKALTGRKFSSERRKALIGRKFSSEHAEKISMANKGKKKPPFSKEHRKKLSETHKGSKSYLWKGGITSLTQNIRACFKYRQWRSDVFTRDDFTCVLCGERGVYIEADHYPKMFLEIFQENKIKSFEEALNCEEFWNINNGRTLCRKCHDLTKNQKKIEEA